MATIGQANVNDIDADPVILPVMTDQLRIENSIIFDGGTGKLP